MGKTILLGLTVAVLTVACTTNKLAVKNGEPIPPLHGFPVRILNPGYFGVKQPAWVTSIEVVDIPMKDYWEDRGWDCSPPMGVGSIIFRPIGSAEVAAGKALHVTGAAFGGARVATVELTSEKGNSWTTAMTGPTIGL